MALPFLVDPELWSKTRAGARAGRGFRYQDAVAAWLAIESWRGEAAWTALIPEGVDDLTLHGEGFEFRAQLKARHDPRGIFSQSEAARYLAKGANDLPEGWRENPRIRLALVLERPLEDAEPTGWTTSLADGGQSLSALEEGLIRELGEAKAGLVRTLLTRTHLIVESDPAERACAALAAAPLPPAAARLAFQQLRERAGDAADTNYSATPGTPAMLDRSDVQTTIDGVYGVVDPAGYLALTGGLVDIANFRDPLPTAAFYRGVNVAPGHVTSGLVFERPQPMVDILAALEAKRFALVAGPSGAGKSALAWLAAHHTRHAVRWYRVRELQTADVAKLAQLAKLLEAGPSRPIGFVVDDVGRQETMGWDALVREIEAQAGVLAIGTVREEDTFLLSTAARTPTIRPQLDEDLAHRVWQELKRSGEVSFSHWREPFELSQGLLLEYTHLLTSGERLEETIREQVRRRIAEDRGDELAILRTVSFAAAQGAAVDQSRLRSMLGLDEIHFAKALQRLIDEHAVRTRADGALTGLHEIRSTHLDAAIQELFGDRRDVAIQSAAKTVVPDSFSAFIVRVLRRWPTEEAGVLEGLVARLKPDEPMCWTPIFHGLGLATADRVAEKWLAITREAKLDDRYSSFVLGLAIAGSDLEGELFAKMRQAQIAFASVDVPDLRRLLIELAVETLQPPTMDLRATHELTAALLPIAGSKSPPELNFSVAGDLSLAPLDDLLPFLGTLRDIGLDRASALLGAVGGSEVLLERIFQEVPWVTRPIIGEAEGQRCVTGYVRYIHPDLQPNLNAEVVRLCEAMAAAVPDAGLLISDALLVNGRPFGHGDYTFMTKRMPRSVLPAAARVAWNRAQIRSVHRLVATPTETQRTTALAQAVEELSTKLREAGDFFCRMELPKRNWQMFLHVRSLLTSLVQPPSIDESVSGPLERGGLNDGDNLHSFVTGLQQLIDELTDGKSDKPALIAARAADLARDAELLLRPELWRMTSEPPLETLAQIRDTLWEIRAVLGDTVNDPEQRRRAAIRFGRMSRRHHVLTRAAREARERAEARLADQREIIRIAMSKRGLETEVRSRPSPEDGGLVWPDAEFLVLRKVDTLIDWYNSAEAFAEAMADLKGLPKISYGAVIGDHLAPDGLSFIQSLLPTANLTEEWAKDLPYTPVQDEDLKLYTEAFDAIGTMSAIGTGMGREPNLKEIEALDDLASRCGRSMELLQSKLEISFDELLAEAIASLVRAVERIQAELEHGGERTVALDLLDSLGGSMSDLSAEIAGVRVALLERAVTNSR